MIATAEEQRLLEKWQKKLCLQEWRIKLVTHLRPEEMSVSNATGVRIGRSPLKPPVLRSSTPPATATALYRSTLKRHWFTSCCT